MDEVVKERYDPGQWNTMRRKRQTVITGPTIQRCVMRFRRKAAAGSALLQLARDTRRAHSQTLWREYEHLQATFDNFAISISFPRSGVFIRYSANCFRNRAPIKTYNKYPPA